MPQGRRKILRGELNELQEMFCQLYATGEKEFFGNGVQSYLEVYEIDREKPNYYNTACVQASMLLSNPKVVKRITELLDGEGFNDVNIQKQHTFLINQFEDLPVKQRAISDYYKLKGKYAPEELKIKINSIEEVKKRLENLKKL